MREAGQTLSSGPYAYPPAESLVRALERSLGAAAGASRVEVLRRAPNAYQSSSATEVVTCRLDEGEPIELFCKYGYAPQAHIEHRGGVAREARVYATVLSPLGLGPRYFGSCVDPETGQTWLFVEYLHDAVRVSKGPQPASIKRAARWLACLHTRAFAASLTELERLPRYDVDYYVSWLERTARYAHPLHAELPWLGGLFRTAITAFELLEAQPYTLIHGEYYPDNILLLDEAICPVDWEAAALAPGEIDLGSLTMRWPPSLQRVACRAYYAHHSAAPRAEREKVLAAAKLYWAMRWLGYKREWTVDPVCRPWFSEMHDSGKRLGLV